MCSATAAISPREDYRGVSGPCFYKHINVNLYFQIVCKRIFSIAKLFFFILHARIYTVKQRRLKNCRLILHIILKKLYLLFNLQFLEIF